MILIQNIIKEIVEVFLEMSPYLLFGFLLAGILKLLIPRDLLYKHLSKRNFWSIFKASIFGVPLPLCSCGIIPVAGHLKKEGASKGAIISFLSSTPTTGVDSIFATYALLGPVFAIIRPAVALITGIIAGTLDFIFAAEKKEIKPYKDEYSCVICDKAIKHKHKKGEKFKFVLNYAFVVLIADLGKWLMIGVILSGIISALTPATVVENYLSNSFVSYAAMIIIGIPLYVCSTGSIPIATSFIKVGLSPGAALVFLIAGPATNSATISFVGGKLGKRSLFVYLFSIALVSILAGLFVDNFLDIEGISTNIMNMKGEMLPHFIKVISAIIFLALLLNVFIRKRLINKKPKNSCCSSDLKKQETTIKETSCCSNKDDK